MKSYKAQTNIITRGGKQLGETRIRYTSPNAFYCICPITTQWGRSAVISQLVNELPPSHHRPFSFSCHDTNHCCSRVGPWLWETQRSHCWWSLQKPRMKSPESLKILSLLHISIPGQLKMGTEALFLKTSPYQLPFFYKTHTPYCAWSA